MDGRTDVTCGTARSSAVVRRRTRRTLATGRRPAGRGRGGASGRGRRLAGVAAERARSGRRRRPNGAPPGRRCARAPAGTADLDPADRKSLAPGKTTAAAAHTCKRVATPCEISVGRPGVAVDRVRPVPELPEPTPGTVSRTVPPRTNYFDANAFVVDFECPA